MSALNEYKSWHDHYLAMVNGQIAPNQKVYVVDTKQTGSGNIKIVSPSQAKVQRARAAVKPKAIKSKPKKKIGQNTSNRRTVKTKPRSSTPKRKR